MKNKVKNILLPLFSLMLVLSLVMLSGLKTEAAGTDMSTASSISVNKLYTTNSEEGTFFYKFRISTSGKAEITVPLGHESEIAVYAESGKKLLNGDVSSTGKQKAFLNSGLYYVSYKHDKFEKNECKIKVLFTSANESFREIYGGSNNTVTKANKIALNKSFRGFFSEEDRVDCYVLSVPKNGTQTLSITSSLGTGKLEIYKKTGLSRSLLSSISFSGTSYRKQLNLKEGSYYFIFKAFPKGNTYTKGAYQFNVSMAGIVPSDPDVTVTSKPCALELNWNKLSNASGYIVYRSRKAGIGYKEIARTTGLTYTDRAVEPGLKYYYRVKAYNSRGVGAASLTVSGRAKLATPKIAVRAQNYSRNRVYTSRVKYAEGYEVFRAVGANGTYKYIGNMKELTIDHTALRSGTTYYYMVRAFRVVDGIKVYSEFSRVKSCTAL